MTCWHLFTSLFYCSTVEFLNCDQSFHFFPPICLSVYRRQALKGSYSDAKQASWTRFTDSIIFFALKFLHHLLLQFLCCCCSRAIVFVTVRCCRLYWRFFTFFADFLKCFFLMLFCQMITIFECTALWLISLLSLLLCRFDLFCCPFPRFFLFFQLFFSSFFSMHFSEQFIEQSVIYRHSCWAHIHSLSHRSATS